MIRFVPLIAVTLLCGVVHAQVPEDGPGRWTFPQTRISNGYAIIMHAPQIRSWPDFEHFDARVVLEVTHPDSGRTQIGSLVAEGQTTVDLEGRLVRSSAPRIKNLFFPDALSEQTRAAIRGSISKKPLQIPLDLFLAHLADSVLASPPPAGFNFEPPAIHVAQKPTILLMVGGEPVMTEIANSPLERLVNANWPVFKEAGGTQYYLLHKKRWLTAQKLRGPWRSTTDIPASFGRLPAAGGFAPIRAAVPPAVAEGDGPAVIFTDGPAELIVIDGAAKLMAIEDAAGLSYISNTESPLFKLGQTWYFLVAGRWFATDKNLLRGPWTWQQTLPEAFSKIPPDHAMAAVRASITATPEARMAALEASLPTTKAVPVNSAAPVEVTYQGAPSFEPIPNTPLKRAANSGYDIIEYENRHYLCYSGAWYEAPAPTGPWLVSSNVPEAIYTIPPSSPSYHVTQVKLQQSNSDEIVYVYPPAYSTSVYVVYGVPYYGTGWYYPPYLYGALYSPYWYYPYYGSYGGGNWYNPNTGRYGRGYTVWDGDEWASYNESYNPRTGVASATSRYYNEDDNRLEMERVSARGDEWVATERTTDFDSQKSNTQRETSRGGESNVARSWDNGKLTTSGTFETGDGRTGTIEGSHTRDGGTTTITGSGGNQASVTRDVNASGVSREGTFTRDGETLTTQTQRSGAGATTEFQTSGGATGKSVTTGAGNRVTVGQSSSGDLYAASNGQVYKRSGDQWQARDDGTWRATHGGASASTAQGARETLATSRDLDAARGERSGSAAAARDTVGQRSGTQSRPGQLGTQSDRRGSLSSRDRSALDRDYRARQSGRSSFERRGAWDARSRGGGFDRGGFSRGRSGRGGFGGGGLRSGGGGRRR